MAVNKRRKKKRPVKKKKRYERRFELSGTRASTAGFAAGAVGAIALGAGVYGQWVQEPPFEWAKYIVAGGAAVLGVALWFGDVGAVPIRVGDAGIGIEKNNDIVRLAWCDIDTISLDKGDLVIKGNGSTFRIPVEPLKHGCAWILREAKARVPETVQLSEGERNQLPKPRPSEGEELEIESVQVVGRECAASEEVIDFERNARLCPTCGQVYHKAHVPGECVTCGESLARNTLRA